jgi:hypothetical protein
LHAHAGEGPLPKGAAALGTLVEDVRANTVVLKAAALGLQHVMSAALGTVERRNEVSKDNQKYRKRLFSCLCLSKAQSARFERMRERCRKLQKQYDLLLEKHKAAVKAFHGNPDMEEGPHMGMMLECRVVAKLAFFLIKNPQHAYQGITEEEFYDAVETGLDKLDKMADDGDGDLDADDDDDDTVSERDMPVAHRLAAFIDEKVRVLAPTPLIYCLLWCNSVLKVQSNLGLVNEEGSGWELVHSDGDMTVFSKDSEEDNNTCTRCRTIATFPGITARELCEFFYNPNEKMSWDGACTVSTCCRTQLIFFVHSDIGENQGAGTAGSRHYHCVQCPQKGVSGSAARQLLCDAPSPSRQPKVCTSTQKFAYLLSKIFCGCAGGWRSPSL